MSEEWDVSFNASLSLYWPFAFDFDKSHRVFLAFFTFRVLVFCVYFFLEGC